jgi:Zn-finger nucleic acid-binding protein
MTVCPQCGYERTSKDNGFVSAEECPKCGIFYSKWKPSTVSKNIEPVLTNRKALHSNKDTKTNYLFLILISILGTASWAIPKILNIYIVVIGILELLVPIS